MTVLLPELDEQTHSTDPSKFCHVVVEAGSSVCLCGHVGTPEREHFVEWSGGNCLVCGRAPCATCESLLPLSRWATT